MVYFAIGIAAAALVYLVFAAKLIFDDRIDSDEDIEKYLEIAVIGIIPDANATSGKKYGRYGRYGRTAGGSHAAGCKRIHGKRYI